MDAARTLIRLPRSVLFTVWAQHLGSPEVSLRDAVRAVQADDEPHTIEGPADFGPTDGSLADLFASWASVDLATVVPGEGELAGVPVVARPLAMRSGECVLARGPGGCWAAVPRVQRFGSALEPGHLVAWQVVPAPDWRGHARRAMGTLDGAESDLREGLVRATEALAALDVAEWGDDVAEAIASVRSADAAGWPLPPALSTRVVQALVTAARLRAIVQLARDAAPARADDDGAWGSWVDDGATRRALVLDEVDRIARRAMSAATLELATSR